MLGYYFVVCKLFLKAYFDRQLFGRENVAIIFLLQTLFFPETLSVPF